MHIRYYRSVGGNLVGQKSCVHLNDRRLAALLYTDAQKRAYDLPAVPQQQSQLSENHSSWAVVPPAAPSPTVPVVPPAALSPTVPAGQPPRPETVTGLNPATVGFFD